VRGQYAQRIKPPLATILAAFRWDSVVASYDLQSAEFFRDPYATLARMRQDDPLYWDESLGTWLATRYSDVRAITRDGRMSVARMDFLMTGTDEKSQVVRRFLGDWMLFSDPPGHTRMRQLVARAFAPRAVGTLEAAIQRIVDEALAGVDGAGQIDIVRDLGFPVPSRVIADMLGVDRADIPQFEKWSHDTLAVPSLLGDPDENVAISYQGIRNLEDYFRTRIAERRAAPADDLLGLLVQADADGNLLTEDEVVANCALLLIAGHETTTNLIGLGMVALLSHPGELARLRAQPELAGQAVEEFLRYDGPVSQIMRLAGEDVELSTGTVPAGSAVLGVPISANRDPAVFTDPDRLDITRGDSRHLGFGGGLHACIGATLARLETRIALTTLLARYPRLELAGEPDWRGSWTVRGPATLPVAV
jgi:cytochrome P450